MKRRLLSLLLAVGLCGSWLLLEAVPGDLPPPHPGVDSLIQQGRDLLAKDQEAAGPFALEVEAQARKKGNPDQVVNALVLRGKILTEQFALHEAKKLLREAYQKAVASASLESVQTAADALGRVMFMRGEFEEAREIFQRLAYVSFQLQDPKSQADAYNGLGIINDVAADMPAALRWHYRALGIREEMGDTIGIGISSANLGLIYRNLGNLEKALSMMQKADSLYSLKGESEKRTTCLINIGILYQDLKQSDSALVYYHKGLALEKERGNVHGIANVMINLSSLHQDLGNLDLCEQYLNQANSIADSIGDLRSYHWSLMGLADLSLELEDYPTAIVQGLQVYPWAQKNEDIHLVNKVSEILYLAYEQMQNYREGFRYLEVFQQTNDSLLDEESIQKATLLQAERQFEQEKKIQSIRQKSQEEVYELRLAREKSYRNFLILAFALSILVLTLLVINNRYRRRANRLLKERNDLVIRQRNQISALNQNLEAKVETRTQALRERNELLVEYAFLNSHKVRGPLARILGLIEVSKSGGFSSPEEQAEMLQYMHISAEALDQAVREIASQLESDLPESNLDND